MIWIMGAMVAVAGMLATFESGANAALARALGSPIVGALCATAVNASVYLLAAAWFGFDVPKAKSVMLVPWWAWLGGVFAAFYVLVTIFFSEKLGAGVFIGLAVTASIVTSVAADHFGLVGFHQHTASWPRLAGAALMIGGLALVSAF